MRKSVGLMGLPAPLIGYDGMVQIGGAQVKVTDGVLRMGPRRLFVDEDGSVLDEKQKPVAKVVNGTVTPLQQPQQQGAPNG